VLAELEEVLFTADIGVKTASRLVELAREKAKSNADLKPIIRDEVQRIVTLKANHQLGGGGPPHVIMVVGVNGAGKTTSIGKLARRLTDEGRKVLLAAGDTFRAAAAEQLDIWAERSGAQIVQQAGGADPGAVVFDALRSAQARNIDVLIADTAGRLHGQTHLMEELKKIRRVIQRVDAAAPDEVLLVLDANQGQNALAQAKEFHAAVGVTGLVLTKLDGTARGGVVVAIARAMQLPIRFIGIGEQTGDFDAFDAEAFVDALLGTGPGAAGSGVK
jgi:fused signal recognition particle receptor